MINKEEFRKYAIKGQNIGSVVVDKYIDRIESMSGHYVQNMTRSVIEERPTNFREIDVFSRLMMDRIIFLGMAIDDHVSNIITAQLLFLESADSKKDILIYVNSP